MSGAEARRGRKLRADALLRADASLPIARAWRVPVERIVENGYNLDLKNPHTSEDREHLPPERLVADILR
jgi:hypothetical protein